MEKEYYLKYLKYKQKYIELKNQYGGLDPDEARYRITTQIKLLMEEFNKYDKSNILKEEERKRLEDEINTIKIMQLSFQESRQKMYKEKNKEKKRELETEINSLIPILEEASSKISVNTEKIKQSDNTKILIDELTKNKNKDYTVPIQTIKDASLNIIYPGKSPKDFRTVVNNYTDLMVNSLEDTQLQKLNATSVEIVKLARDINSSNFFDNITRMKSQLVLLQQNLY